MSRLGAREATRAYLGWLGSRIPLVAADLKVRAEAMPADPLRFLRGSYYLWLLRAAEEIPEVLEAPRLFAVGDAHVENFGIWLDGAGRRVWGVNDFDEIGLAPYMLDLVRTAGSALVSAAVAGGLRLGGEALAELLLEGWVQGVDDPSALVLDGGAHPHLTSLAPSGDAHRFWEKLDAAPAIAEVPEVVSHLVTSAGLVEPVWRHRQAGTGSLGHRRVLALGTRAGARAACEAKELGPPTVEWPAVGAVAKGWRGSADRGWEAITGMAGFPPDEVRKEGWVMRRLGPESGRIELAGLDRRRDESALVRSMGRALGAVHAAADPRSVIAARRHADGFGPAGLRRAAEAMAASVTRDFHHFS